MNGLIKIISLIFLTVFMFSSNLVAEETATSEQAPQITQKRDFDIALKSKTVKALSVFIKRHPESKFVADAVNKIWEVLLTKYPSSKYRSSTNLESLTSDLPAAIHANSVFLVTFTPKSVACSRGWSFNTYFHELAGQPVKLENMSPSIEKPNGDVYSFGNGSHEMTHSVSISPYGHGKYNWWCGGDFSGSSVTLNYEVVSSYTTFREFKKQKIRGNRR